MMLGVILAVVLAALLWSLQIKLRGRRTARVDLAADWPDYSSRDGRPLYPFEGHMDPPADPPRALGRIPDERSIARIAESVRVAERDAFYDRRAGFNWWLARQERMHALLQLHKKWYGHEDEEL